MDNFTSLYVRRVEKFLQRIAGQVLAECQPFAATFARTKTFVHFAERLKLKYRPIGEGKLWGRTRERAWFHLQAQVPASWQGQPVVAHLDFTGEGLVFDPQGNPLQGISSGSAFNKEFTRDVVRLIPAARGGEEVELWVEAVASSLFGLHQDPDPLPNDPHRFGHFEARVKRMSLCRFDELLWHLWLDGQVLFGLVKALPEGSVRRARLLRRLNEAIDAYRDDPSRADRCREILRPELEKPAAPSDLAVLAVGHAHIDTAWLWPITETVHKCVRTFASQVTLLERYPDYVFGASQPQHYQFVKETQPALYEKIRRLVKAGRWELQGGMWVEADCNLISGESLIRQILHGKNFFREEFGVEVRHLWLPDVFGYSAALPQILRKSGIDYFLTQKISWNQFNRFPYHTFRWRGIDGSEVITHFPPEDTYNSPLSSESLVRGRENFREKDLLDEFLSLFGMGDGGGGPKEEHIEFGRRLANLEGAPRVRFGPAADFFRRLEKQRSRLPVWVGELYLELHRGTFTTQAEVKKLNRRLEHRLRETEMLWSCLPLAEYPARELEALWKTVLTNQFHDILPGSSIHEQYRITRGQLTGALQQLEGLQKRAASRLFRRDRNALVLFNSLSFPYRGAVELPAGWGTAVAEGEAAPLPSQKEGERTVVAVEVPPLSFLTLRKSNRAPSPTALPASLVLENERVRYEFSPRGRLVRAFDKEVEREVLEPGQQGNLLRLYDDHPNDWDAWDVDLFYENALIEEAEADSHHRIVAGPVREGLYFHYRIGNSEIEQRVFLNRGSKRLDFCTTVQWRERHRMLRVAFPVNVHSEQASFDISYGFVQRPTHRNTSWEKAKFEVVAHRYADLSEPDYGVALLNDCKYGYRVHNNVLDLNLLRAPTYPDPEADRGEHQFTYSLLPHRGNLVESEVIPQAAMLNQGLAVFPGFRADGVEFPLKWEGEGISLEVLKKAERENRLVFRLVEIHGRHSPGKLRFLRPVRLIETNLLEENEQETGGFSDKQEVVLTHFQISTFKIAWE